MRELREELFKRLDEKEDKIKEIRRHLHEYPELSFEEEETSAYIKDFYKDKDVKIYDELNGQHGLVVEIKGDKPGKTIGLRADFDALPIKEASDVPFKSKNDGVMHACGHDAHTAYLMVVAETLIEMKSQLPGTVKIIHQHAEEVPPGGARDIIASGAIDDLDEIYGIHYFPQIETGKLFIHSGPTFAGRSNFDLTIKGKGGHAALPQEAKDALVAGAYFVTEAQTVVSRRIDPLETMVVTVSAFDAPGGYNVIQDEVTLRGTVRYMNEDLKETAYNEIKRIVEGIETSFGVTADLDYKYDYRVLHNSEQETKEIIETLNESAGTYFKEIVDLGEITGSEDFSYYLTQFKGNFFVVGAMPENSDEMYSLHHPKMKLNEDAFIIAAKSVTDVLLSRLTK
ncbi:amidohydrolase [Staphylococcus massiliensis]|uniref:amidohydrolase n=1 Tax=Staphylococcus massiliensis TaxID=555791 RepID=UPI001EDFCB3B|nr:amidohydrolase [Staphylococcus massiliensis]MCG3401922.1 amidohydrolase [Staphylococcus massiliensis]